MNLKKEFWRVVRFGITGSISTLIHYGVYCLILLWANYNIAYTGGYLVGLLCNYFLTTYFTFQKQASKRNATGFIFSHLLNYLLEMALLNVAVWIGIGELIAPIVVLVIVVPINYLILRFVYRSKE